MGEPGNEATAKPNAALLSFWSQRHELPMEQGCILRGIHVVILPVYNHKYWRNCIIPTQVLCKRKLLSEAMCGVATSQPRSRKTGQSCSPPPPPTPIPWLWPSKPWQHIHIDYAGPIYKKMMLVVDKSELVPHASCSPHLPPLYRPAWYPLRLDPWQLCLKYSNSATELPSSSVG